MFETLATIIATVVAVYLLLTAAFPDRFMPKRKNKDEFYGANEWGVYEGASTDVPKAHKTIKKPKPNGKERVIAGSGMYAMGKGISFRR
ncbi:MAG: hypothetical protein U0105_11795 [Candidatus Obscuribacterales bacterium]|jgi:hypothetical protein